MTFRFNFIENQSTDNVLVFEAICEDVDLEHDSIEFDFSGNCVFDPPRLAVKDIMIGKDAKATVKATPVVDGISSVEAVMTVMINGESFSSIRRGFQP